MAHDIMDIQVYNALVKSNHNVEQDMITNLRGLSFLLDKTDSLLIWMKLKTFIGPCHLKFNLKQQQPNLNSKILGLAMNP